jgi:hypothetical protein
MSTITCDSKNSPAHKLREQNYGGNGELLINEHKYSIMQDE